MTDAHHRAMNARRRAESMLAKDISRIRRVHAVRPYGYFDSAGRFYPSKSEICECCEGIRRPTRKWPRSLYIHCCTKSHIRRLIKKKGMVDRLLRELRGFSSETAKQIQHEFDIVEMLDKQYRDEICISRVTSHARRLDVED